MANGDDYVTRHEWQMYRDYIDKQKMPERIDRLERIIDRFTGPFTVLVATLGICGTTASIVTAVVVLANAGA